MDRLHNFARPIGLSISERKNRILGHRYPNCPRPACNTSRPLQEVFRLHLPRVTHPRHKRSTATTTATCVDGGQTTTTCLSWQRLQSSKESAVCCHSGISALLRSRSPCSHSLPVQRDRCEASVSTALLTGIRWPNVISSSDIYLRANLPPATKRLTVMRLRLLGHTIRTLTREKTPLVLALTVQPTEPLRPGRPRMQVHDQLRNDLALLGVKWNDAPTLANNKKLW